MKWDLHVQLPIVLSFWKMEKLLKKIMLKNSLSILKHKEHKIF